AGRMFFWTTFFVFWVLVAGHYSDLVLDSGEEWRWIKFVGPRIHVNVSLVLWGMAPFTALATGVWLIVYWLVVLRRNVGRLLVSFFVPLGLYAAIFAHLYMAGGVGGLHTTAAIEAQPGVERVFGIEQIESGMTQRNHPRDVCVDTERNVLFASFGCTFCPSAVRYPTLIRYDLTTKQSQWFVSGPIREFDCPADTDFVLLAPWQDNKIFVLHRDDLKILQSITPPYETEMDIWEPMGIVLDRVNNRIVVVNDVEPAVVAVEASTGRWIGARNLWREGLTGYGVAAQTLVQDVPGGPVYFAGGYGENLFQVDPKTLEILNHMPLDDAAGTAIAVDTPGDRLYYQASLHDTISEVRLSTFSVVRELEGERFARGLAVDKERNVLYVLGYFSGTLYPIDLTTGERGPWTLHVGGRPNSLDLRDGKVWVNSMAGVLGIDLAEVWAAHAEGRL
ncbi:MAG: YncE family protein, partial [Myxococcota bacterium]